MEIVKPFQNLLKEFKHYWISSYFSSLEISLKDSNGNFKSLNEIFKELNEKLK